MTSLFTRLGIAILVLFPAGTLAAGGPFLPVQKRTGEEAIAAIEDLSAQKQRVLFRAFSENTGTPVSEIRERVARGDYKTRACKPGELITTAGFQSGVDQLTAYTQRPCREGELLIILDEEVLTSTSCGNPLKEHYVPYRAQMDAEPTPEEHQATSSVRGHERWEITMCRPQSSHKTVTRHRSRSTGTGFVSGWGWYSLALLSNRGSTTSFVIVEEGGTLVCP